VSQRLPISFRRVSLGSGPRNPMKIIRGLLGTARNAAEVDKQWNVEALSCMIRVCVIERKIAALHSRWGGEGPATLG